MRADTAQGASAELDALRLEVLPGAGIVARFPGVVLVVPKADAAQQTALQRLVDLCRAAGVTGAGRRLARRVAGVIATTDPEQVPDFALLTALPDGSTAVIVLGDLFVDVEANADAGERLSGASAATWLDRVVRATGFVVTSDAEGVGGVFGDLVEGVVPGSGAVLAPRLPAGTPQEGARRADDEPATATSQEVPDTSAPRTGSGGWTGAPGDDGVDASASCFPLPDPPTRSHEQEGGGQDRPGQDRPGEGRPDPEEAVLEPDDREGEGGGDQRSTDQSGAVGGGPDFDVVSLEGGEEVQAAPLPPTPEQRDKGDHEVLVKGIHCPLQHLNHPKALYCNVCGRALVHVTRVEVEGVRPPLGVLVLDDAVFTLDADYVIGREPERDERVARGELRALRLDDPEDKTSRVHAEVRLDGWDVLVVDRESANGTYVATEGSDAWRPLSAGEPVALTPGSRVRIGPRVLQFETRHHR